jgi:transcriptional regulator with XRE-family HTH domain
MSNKTRNHLTDDADVQKALASELAPTHMKKQMFGNRLFKLMVEKGWSQSELARRASIPRDAVSIYIRGKSFPSPQKLAALAAALGVAETTLLPNQAESAIDEDNPSFEMKVSPNAPSVAWLRVNRLVSTATAVKIAELLSQESGDGKAA